MPRIPQSMPTKQIYHYGMQLITGIELILESRNPGCFLNPQISTFLGLKFVIEYCYFARLNTET